MSNATITCLLSVATGGKPLQVASLDAVVLKGHRFKLRSGFLPVPQPRLCLLLLMAACIVLFLFLSHCRSQPKATVGNKTTHHSRLKELTHCAAETIRRCPAMLRTAAVMSACPCGKIRPSLHLSDLRDACSFAVFFGGGVGFFCSESCEYESCKFIGAAP